MINHARTLLLNVAPNSNHISADTAAEYVPASFFPVKLTNELKLIRRIFFGSRPDARFLNLRVRELMGYVHQTDAAHYVYDLDSRVTYWPVNTNAFSTATRSQINITQLFGPTYSLPLVGTFRPDNTVGKAMRQYVVSVGIRPPSTPPNTLPLVSPDLANTVLAVQQLGTINAPQTFDVLGISSTSTATLPETDLKITLNFASTPGLYANLTTETDGFLLHENYAEFGPIISEQLSSTMPLIANLFDTLLAQWFVTVKATPSPIITTMLPTLELLGEPVFLNLFGVRDVEPYSTFKNMWFDHYSPVYRIAGLILAVIYRTEELRRG